MCYVCGYDLTMMLRSAKHRHCKGKSNIHLEILIIFFPDHTTNDSKCPQFIFHSVLIVIARSIRYSFIFTSASEKFNFLPHTKFLGSHFFSTIITQWEYQRRLIEPFSVASYSRKNCVHVPSTSDRI